LKLDHNIIGVQGATCFSEVLMVNSSLCVLDLYVSFFFVFADTE